MSMAVAHDDGALRPASDWRHSGKPHRRSVTVGVTGVGATLLGGGRVRDLPGKTQPDLGALPSANGDA